VQSASGILVRLIRLERKVKQRALVGTKPGTTVSCVS
jgi:hypothetical protein